MAIVINGKEMLSKLNNLISYGREASGNNTRSFKIVNWRSLNN